MTRHKFIKKHGKKYMAILAASLYATTMVAPQVVNATGKNKTEVVSQINVPEGMRLIENLGEISSEKLKVKLDLDFPSIVEYEMNGKVMKGRNVSSDEFKINETIYNPQVTAAISEDKTSCQYVLTFNDINVEITLSLKVEGNSVKLQFDSINEKGNTKVGKIEIPNHNLISIDANDGSPDIASARVHGTLKSDDYFYNLNDKGIDQKPVAQSMIILENGDLAASVESNVLDYRDKVVYQTTEDTGVKTAGAWNGAWTYREKLSETQMSPVVELPWSRIVISDDKNDDGAIDWQDGAVGFRDYMVKPKGYDVVKDKVSHVAMNFASQAQYPFDRLTDQVAKYSNYLDGFGQMMLVKGYQSEGHDSAHPDYGNNFNERAGGVEEFNEMAKTVGDKYNTLVGVHINQHELYPEAKYFLDDVLSTPYTRGWGWLDQSYLVDKRKDTLNEGETGLRARLAELKKATSELDWVYVDVYNSNPWNEHKMQEFLMENDWLVATEWSGPMRQNAIWTHWADLTYDKGNISNGVDYGEQYRGTRSQIVRFVENEMKDVFPNDILLKGNKNKGFMGWEGDAPREKNIEYSVETFYNWTLPTKYMQHFPVVKWTENEVKFEKDLISKVTNLDKDENGKVLGGDTELIKDGNLIYSGTTYRNNNDRVEDAGDKLLSKNNRVFIPYSETDIEKPEKIYAWNDFKESKEWNIPKSWVEEGVSSTYLYKTGGDGRELVEEINVVDGTVTLELDATTPYVLYKGQVDETIGSTVWGETSAVGDMGFDSYDFKETESDEYGWWTPSSTIDTVDHITFDKESGTSVDGRFTNNIGQTYLKVSGAHDGAVTQAVKVEGGKEYSATVMVEITPGADREAGLEVVVGNDKHYNSITSTNYKNYTVNSDKHDTYFQRVKVDFSVPEGVSEVTLNLKAKGGEATSYVRFDNVRLVEHKRSEEEIKAQKENYFFEDFESVDEAYGPFVYGLNGSCQTHLSEKNEGVTNDTINGDWSMKIAEWGNGIAARTIPGLLKLEPNKKYSIKLDYKFPNNDFWKKDEMGKYEILVRSDKAKGTDQEDMMRVRLANYDVNEETGKGTGAFEYTFQTGNYDDYYIAIDKIGSGILVIDDLTINEYDGEIDEAFPVPPKDPVHPLIIPQETMTATATSFEGVGDNNTPEMTIDGNEETIWTTAWDLSDELPQSITLDLGGKYLIDKYDYLPRQSGGQNGIITKYELQISDDGENFETVSAGDWKRDSELKTINFEAREATKVRLVALEGAGGYASAAELNVYQKAMPTAAPTNLQVEEVTHNTAKVSWEAPTEGNEHVDEYVVYLNGKELRTVNKDTLEYTIEGLKPNTEYTIEVASKNSQGLASEKLSTNITTREEVVEEIIVSKVNKFKKGEVTSNSVELTWEEPKNTVGLESYILYKDGKEVAIVPANTNIYNVEGLKTNTIYGFKIVSKYSNGEESKPVSINVRTKK